MAVHEVSCGPPSHEAGNKQPCPNGEPMRSEFNSAFVDDSRTSSVKSHTVDHPRKNYPEKITSKSRKYLPNHRTISFVCLTICERWSSAFLAVPCSLLPVPCRSLFVKELAMPAIGPGIVVQGEVGAGLDGGVVVLPELDKGTGVGVFQPGLAEGVEGIHGGFLRVGDDAVNGFLPVYVGLVLKVTAESVAGRRQQEADH